VIYTTFVHINKAQYCLHLVFSEGVWNHIKTLREAVQLRQSNVLFISLLYEVSLHMLVSSTHHTPSLAVLMHGSDSVVMFTEHYSDLRVLFTQNCATSAMLVAR
jgi:hypothetical protein